MTTTGNDGVHARVRDRYAAAALDVLDRETSADGTCCAPESYSPLELQTLPSAAALSSSSATISLANEER